MSESETVNYRDPKLSNQMKNKTLKKKVTSKNARRVNLDIEVLQHYNVQNDKMRLIMKCY